MREIVKRNLAVTRRGDAARRGDRALRGDGRELQGRDHRRHPRRTRVAVPARRVRRPVPRAARAVDRAAQAPSSSPASPAPTGAATSATRCCSASTAPRGRAEADLKRTSSVLEEAKQRDHRRLGQELDLFSLPPDRAGLARSSTRRARSSTTRSIGFIRGLYGRYGYTEVITPLICKTSSSGRRSGHYEDFRDDMFFMRDRGARVRRQADELPGPLLPLRERASTRTASCRCASPTSAGCTATSPRARCTVSRACARSRRTTRTSSAPRSRCRRRSRTFIEMTGDRSPRLRLRATSSVSLRLAGEVASGERRVWEAAEAALRRGPRGDRLSYEINPGDGAFYGPKIDFDCFATRWRASGQLATIQLDLRMPERFDLTYVTRGGQRERRR